MLVEHGVDDVDEGLVAGEEAVASGEDVSFEPAFEGVLGEHLHDAAVGSDVGSVGVLGEDLGHPCLGAGLVDDLKAVGCGLVGAEDAEAGHVLAHDVAEEAAEGVGGGDFSLAGLFDVDGVLAEVGKLEGLAQKAAVGVGIAADAVGAPGGELAELFDQAAIFVEELVGPVALHPLLELLEVLGAGFGIEDRNLVCAPEAFDLVAVDLFGAGPALGGAEDDHWPARALGGFGFAAAGPGLDVADLGDAALGDLGHGVVHQLGVVALDEVGGPAVAAEEGFELFVRDAGEDGGVCNLVAVEVKDGKDGSVADGVEELVGVPAGGERAGLGLAVADDYGDDEVGVVEGRAEAVGERVAELAALVDGAGGLRGAVASDAAGEGELLEELLHSGFVFALVGVDLGVDAFEIAVGEDGGSSVAGAGEVDQVEVVLLDEPVEMHPGEGLAGVGAPVAEQAVLDVLGLEGLAEEGVLLQVEHAGAEVVAGTPVSVHLAQLIVAEDPGVRFLRLLWACCRHVQSPWSGINFYG